MKQYNVVIGVEHKNKALEKIKHDISLFIECFSKTTDEI